MNTTLLGPEDELPVFFTLAARSARTHGVSGGVYCLWGWSGQAGAGQALAVERAVPTMAGGEASVETVPQTFPLLFHHHPRPLGERINQN